MARRAGAVLLALLSLAATLAGCLGGEAAPKPQTGSGGPGDGPGPDDEGPESPPIASITLLETGDITPGTMIRFDGNGSTDPENGTLRYDWDFGDGNTSAGRLVSHAFAGVGEYVVALNVTDPSGLSDLETVRVNVQPVAPGTPVAVFDWSVQGEVLVPNPLMERMGRDAPFLGQPWPVLGGASLRDFQARSLGAGIDHLVYRIEGVPTNGTRLAFTLEWDAVASPPTIETLVDLDLFVFDADGALLGDGFMAATGAAPETFVVDDALNLTKGTYHALVLLFRGVQVDFTLRASLMAPPGQRSPLA